MFRLITLIDLDPSIIVLGGRLESRLLYLVLNHWRRRQLASLFGAEQAAVGARWYRLAVFCLWNCSKPHERFKYDWMRKAVIGWSTLLSFAPVRQKSAQPRLAHRCRRAWCREPYHVFGIGPGGGQVFRPGTTISFCPYGILSLGNLVIIQEVIRCTMK